MADHDLQHECAIFLACRRPSATEPDASVLPWVLNGLKAQSNRGQEGYGLATLKPLEGPRFRTMRSAEAITEVSRLSEVELDIKFAMLEGGAIIGHNRYATQGPPDENNSQPMVGSIRRADGENGIAMAFNGHIANADELRIELEESGRVFNGTTDTEVVLALIVEIAGKAGTLEGAGLDYRGVFATLDAKIDGACSLLLLDELGNFVLYRNRNGIRPLEFFESVDGMLLAASETEAFAGIEGQHRTINPGEALVYTRDHDSWMVAKVAGGGVSSYCVLELLYFSRANSLYKGYSHYRIRRDIGIAMADEERERIAEMSSYERARTRVMPVPNTAIPYAIGFSNALDLPYEMGVERREGTRAFINSGRDTRLDILQRKFAVLDEAVAGKIIMMVDDTLVRRETSQTITTMLRSAGAERVEWYIGAPPFQGTCYYGIAVPSVSDLAYWNAFAQLPSDAREGAFLKDDLDRIEKQIAADIGADRVKFLRFKQLLGVLPGTPDSYCHGCFGRRYPTPKGEVTFQASLARFLADQGLPSMERAKTASAQGTLA